MLAEALEVGGDLDVAQSIGNTIGADVPERIDELVAEGALGRKTGRGFYTY